MTDTRFPSRRKGERGMTILLVVAAMVTLLGMAALAIDVVTLYVARTEAQRAADAAALAAAKMFVTTGFTSGMLGLPSVSSSQSRVCVSGGPGGSAAANMVAQSAAAENLIAGHPAAIQSIACNFSTPENPQITVTAQSAPLPIFFARIWSRTAPTASASATAEVFNPSGLASSSYAPLQTGSVKPWLIPNCNPNTAPPCPTSPYFVDPSNNYAIQHANAYIGRFLPWPLTQRGASQPLAKSQYYAIDLPPATVCPQSPPCSSDYCSNIACASTTLLSCGQQVQVDENTGTPSMQTDTAQAVQTLIHAGAPTCSTNSGQDSFQASLGNLPVEIDGGSNNPNPALRVKHISRSDSIVTVPLFDGHDLCSGGECEGSNATIIGFLQLGIQCVRPTGDLQAIVLNAVGCDPNNPNALWTPVTGGGQAPIPVRLVCSNGQVCP